MNVKLVRAPCTIPLFGWMTDKSVNISTILVILCMCSAWELISIYAKFQKSLVHKARFIGSVHELYGQPSYLQFLTPAPILNVMETIWNFNNIISGHAHVVALLQIYRVTWQLFSKIAKFAFLQKNWENLNISKFVTCKLVQYYMYYWINEAWNTYHLLFFFIMVVLSTRG